MLKQSGFSKRKHIVCAEQPFSGRERVVAQRLSDQYRQSFLGPGDGNVK
jgi:hypothetical protein